GTGADASGRGAEPQQPRHLAPGDGGLRRGAGAVRTGTAGRSGAEPDQRRTRGRRGAGPAPRFRLPACTEALRRTPCRHRARAAELGTPDAIDVAGAQALLRADEALVS